MNLYKADTIWILYRLSSVVKVSYDFQNPV